MKTLTLLLAFTVALILAGCSSTQSARRNLIGTWQSTGDTYEFMADGTYCWAPRQAKYKGTYTVESPNLLILNREDGYWRRAKQYFLSGDGLNLVSPEGEITAYKRVKR